MSIRVAAAFVTSESISKYESGCSGGTLQTSPLSTVTEAVSHRAAEAPIFTNDVMRFESVGGRSCERDS